MRIGLTNEFFPPFAPGGAEWSMLDLARALSDKGHQVHVMTPNYGAKAEDKDSGVHVHRYAFPIKIHRERKMPGFIWHANPFFYLWSAFCIYKVAKHERLEILHVQNKYSLIGSWIAGKLLKIPVLASIRDTSNICRIAVCLHHHESVPKDCGYSKLMTECSEEYYQNYYQHKSFFKHAKDKLIQSYHWMDVYLRRFFLNRINAVVGVSRGILEVHERSRVFHLSKKPLRRALYNFVREVHVPTNQSNSILLEKHKLKEGKIILYVGGFSRGKGTDDFVRAAKILKAKLPNIQIVMIGSGALQENTDGIHVLNNIPHDEVLKFYDLSSVVVVPSVCQESLSRVLLEALMAGKPVVGTRVGGTPEAVLHGENGYVVDRGNPQALADAISSIISDDGLARIMGKRSKELALTRFEKSAVIAQVEQLYQTQIGEAAGVRV